MDVTLLAVINIFHGIRTPIPCSTNIKNTNLNLSLGGVTIIGTVTNCLSGE